ncbi:hypothetical protein Tco_1310078 [Tanacetum coccineum]
MKDFPTDLGRSPTNYVIVTPVSLFLCFSKEKIRLNVFKAMTFLSAVASRFPPSNNQIRTSSNPRNQATIQDGRVIVQQVQGRQTREWHMARQCTQPKRPRNAAQFKEKLKLAKAQEEGQILDEEQLAFLAIPGLSEAPVAQQTIPPNSAFQTKDLDAYDLDCDDLSSAKAVLMANLSSCDPEVLSEDTNSSTPNDLLVLFLVEQMTDHVAHLDNENQTNKMVNESLTVELERYKERVAIFEQRLNVDLNKREKLIDSQMDDLIRKRKAKLAAFQQEIDTLKETLSNHVKEKESLSKTLTLNKIKEDFGKSFVTQKELSAEQTFWLKHSSFSETPVTSHTPVRIEAPSELPKISLVNESLKMLKYQLPNFENVVKKKTTSDAITADEITEVQAVFNQIEAVVDQCSVDKNAFEIQIKQLSIDNDQLLKQIMS